MHHFYQNSLVSLLLILIPVSVSAMSRLYDVESNVSLRNGHPCFFYPGKDGNGGKSYSISFLDITKTADGKAGWSINFIRSERKGYVEPDRPETCIEYGVLGPGMKEERAARPLLLDTPYNAFLFVSDATGGNRRFRTDFCITLNEKGETILVEATGGGRGEWRCLKPDESRKRGFWGWLFDK